MVKSAEEREREILDAALRLFHERGFAETSVQDIAAGAGVATGTVYLYFPSKDHVLLGLHEEFERGLESRFAEVVGEHIDRRDKGERFDHREIVGRVVDEVVAYTSRHRQVCEVITRHWPGPDLMPKVLKAERGFVELLTRSFQEGVRSGRMHTSDPEMMAYLVNAALSTTLAFAVTYGEPESVDRLTAQAKELLAKSLAPAVDPEDPRRDRES